MKIRNLSWEVERNLHETLCRQTDKLTYVIFVYKALHWALYHVWFQNKSELYVLKYMYVCYSLYQIT